MMEKLNLTSELLTLLDLIELETEDHNIRSITRQRFDIAKEAGYTVEWCGICGRYHDITSASCGGTVTFPEPEKVKTTLEDQL